MRTMALMLLLLSLPLALLPAASAAPVECADETVGTIPAYVVVEYGTKCQSVDVVTCTLQHDPEYPSTPVWRCRSVVSVP